MTSAYYIYYRVDATHAAACADAALKLLHSMRERTGIQGRLLKKRNEPWLWMEIYEPVADEAKFEWELAEAVASSGISTCLQSGGARHIECFRE